MQGGDFLDKFYQQKSVPFEHFFILKRDLDASVRDQEAVRQIIDFPAVR
jgi:hypothetical protein